MFNVCLPTGLLRKSAMLLVILVAGTQLWAQTTANTTGSQNPFAHLDKALSNAADNLLTAATQRPAEPPLARTIAGQSSEATDARSISGRTGSREKALQRVEQLRPIIEPILREEGVPAELAAVVLIESGGQPTALSPKGARGVWQFMPDTARRYGLTVRPDKDERLDVQKSTRAAARYLRDLYQRFRDWPLALAAYNAGEDRVNAAVEKIGRNEFASVRYSLPLETRDYVPAVLEAMGQMPSLRPVQLLPRGAGYVLYAAANFD